MITHLMLAQLIFMILGGMLHYFYVTDEKTVSERLRAPLKNHKSDKWKGWGLKPTLLALESTTNTANVKLRSTA